MKLRLKNQNLQAQLDALAPPSGFTEALSKVDPETLIEGNFIWFPVRFGKENRYGNKPFRVDLTKNDVECIEAYNPNFWNAFPEVTPPENVWMRFEYKNVNDEIKDIEPCCNDDELIGGRLIYRNGEWRDQHNWTFYAQNIREARFRPWDET